MRCKNCGHCKKSNAKNGKKYVCWENELCGMCAVLLLPELYSIQVRSKYQ